MVLDNANTAVVVSEISQPNVAIQLRAAGTLAPSTPNVARVSTMVGALPRFARDGNDADQQERDDHANNGHGGGLPERNAETERPRAVRHGEHGNIGSEPGPKQTGRRALTLLFGYGVDTLLLDGEGPFLIAHVKLISLNLPSNAAGKRHARRVSAIVHMIQPLIVICTISLRTPFLGAAQPPFDQAGSRP